MMLLVAVGWGCTRNNGDIGSLYGEWQLSATEPAMPDYEQNIFWSFQNDIVKLMEVETGELDASTHDCYGTWTRRGDTLQLDFTHTDDANPQEGSWTYGPLPQLGLAPVQTLRIRTLNGQRLVLETEATDSTPRKYYFTKY